MAIRSPIDALTTLSALTTNKALTLVRVAKKLNSVNCLSHWLKVFFEAHTEDLYILSNTGSL